MMEYFGFVLRFVLDFVLFFSRHSANCKNRDVHLFGVSLSPVLGVLDEMAIALNRQEKQDFLVGVEEKFIFHILFQTQAFSFFSYPLFLNHSRSVFVSLLQLCSAEDWPWGQWHHTKRPAWPWPESLLAALVRLNGGWFHSSLTHYGLLESLSQICGWNVGKHNYARCTWCWLLTKDGNEREGERESGSECSDK